MEKFGIRQGLKKTFPKLGSSKGFKDPFLKIGSWNHFLEWEFACGFVFCCVWCDCGRALERPPKKEVLKYRINQMG